MSFLFLSLNVCAKYGKKWVVMNPECLDEVADSFYSVLPVWVNKHVTSTPCSVWL